MTAPQIRPATEMDWPAIWPIFDEAVRAADSALAEVGDDLDRRSVGTSSRGEPFDVRWILLHMIEEYARHNGHADLIRESIDGSTGA